MEKINLTKYVTEVVQALAGIGKLKNPDVSTAVAVCSVVHQRYEDFDAGLREALIPQLKAPAPDDKEAMLNLRISLRFFAELTIVGVFKTGDFGTFGAALNKLCKQNTEHEYLDIILSVFKHCGSTLMGTASRKMQTLAKKHGASLQQQKQAAGDEAPELVPEKARVGIKKILVAYYQSVADRLVRVKKALNKRRQQNEIRIQTKGELTTEQQEATDAAEKDFAALFGSTTQLADLLDQELPELPEEEPDELTQAMNIDISNPFKDAQGDDPATALWEDPDTQAFYENLTDLRAFVPAVLFRVEKDVASKTADGEDGEASGEDGGEESGEEGDVAPGDGTGTAATAAAEDKEVNMEDLAAEIENMEINAGPLDEEEDRLYEDQPDTMPEPSPGDKLQMLFARLPTCINKKFVDQAAIDFCHLNNKGNRKQLSEALYHVQYSRLDLVPYYARLVATLHPGMKDLAETLVERLQGEVSPAVSCTR